MPIVIDGDYWPEHDEYCRIAALSQVAYLDKAIELCRKKNIVVQAGGNCGIFPRYLAKHFQAVYTFEPENENFYCLAHNAPEKNVIKMQAALGQANTAPLALAFAERNAGAHYMAGSGIIPIIAVDALLLPACDLLQLDIEGYELFALRGAQATIVKYSPVIMIEHKKHADRYGAQPEEVIHYLQGLGYEEKLRIKRDIIFTKGENHV